MSRACRGGWKQAGRQHVLIIPDKYSCQKEFKGGRAQQLGKVAGGKIQQARKSVRWWLMSRQ